MTQPPSEKQRGKKAPGEKPSDTAVSEPPPRRNWAASIGRDAGSAATAAFVRAGFTDPALVLHWTEIAGAEVARIARPVRFSARDGALTLLAEPAAALFLGHESRALMARINAYLGRPAVSRIKFVQGRLTMPPAAPTPKQPARTLNSADPSNAYHGPDGVKAALQSLARWRASDDGRSG
jgi:hypothetical protein